mmetsp:Transcript_45632/g.126627  ORF Transcript_45632/g.126627 Transcript_45632/m.126627 type:complete len:238 (+) Transcript_45632:101-814(+)
MPTHLPRRPWRPRLLLLLSCLWRPRAPRLSEPPKSAFWHLLGVLLSWSRRLGAPRHFSLWPFSRPRPRLSFLALGARRTDVPCRSSFAPFSLPFSAAFLLLPLLLSCLRRHGASCLSSTRPFSRPPRLLQRLRRLGAPRPASSRSSLREPRLPPLRGFETSRASSSLAAPSRLSWLLLPSPPALRRGVAFLASGLRLSARPRLLPLADRLRHFEVPDFSSCFSWLRLGLLLALLVRL